MGGNTINLFIIDSRREKSTGERNYGARSALKSSLALAGFKDGGGGNVVNFCCVQREKKSLKMFMENVTEKNVLKFHELLRQAALRC